MQRRFKRKNVEEKVRNIVYNLLYGVVRQQVNREYQKNQKETQANIWQKFKQHCKQDGIFNVVQGMIIQSNNDKSPPFELLKNDYEREQHYVKLVMQVYEKIVKYGTTTSKLSQSSSRHNITSPHAHIDVEAVTLYVLYAMRFGQFYEGVNILPEDPYLKRFLPDVNHLSLFNLHRSKIKQGGKLLRDAYNNAMNHMDASREDIVLNNPGFVPADRTPLFKCVSRKSKQKKKRRIQ